MTSGYQAALRRNVRQAMAAKGWEPKQLAKALRHKHAQAVNRWLSEDPKKQRAISVENVRKLARVLGVSVATLDPDGKQAYDQSNRPAHMRRGSGGKLGRDSDTEMTDPHTAEDLLHSGNPPSKVGVPLMADPPDPELFDRLTGLWRALDHAGRRDSCAYMARLVGETAHSYAPTAAHAKRGNE